MARSRTVGGDHRSAKLELQPAVEIESENLGIRFTRRVRHVAKLAFVECPDWVVCHERVVANIGGAQLYER